MFPPNENLTFNEIINYLKKKTGLNFRYLKNNFIAITSKKAASILCGYIFDDDTGNPIAGVLIIGKKNYTVTDSYGYFSINLLKDERGIGIRSLGFKSEVILIDEIDFNECPHIYLKPEIESLSEIIIRNYVAKGINKVSDGSIQLNFLNFEIVPGLIETDVLQAIKVLPGIQSVDETVSNINIRGGTNDQNLILWDDIKMYQSGHFFGLISIFNPQMTKEASVMKNGTGAEFSDGVSGTIHMKTSENISASTTASIGLNFTNVDGFLDTPLGNKSSIQIAGRKGISDVIKTPTYTNYFKRISQDTEAEVEERERNFDFYDTSLRWIYTISENDYLRVSGIVVNNNLFFNESINSSPTIETKQSKLTQGMMAASLLYKRSWNDYFSTSLTISESIYDLYAFNVDLIKKLELIQENEVSESSVKFVSFFKPAATFSFNTGYQFTEAGMTDYTEVDNPKYELTITEVIREHSIFSQFNYNSELNKTNINLGVRYSIVDFRDEKSLDFVEPRLSINYKISNEFSIDVLGEFKHQNSSQIVTGQNDFLGIERRRWRLANNKKGEEEYTPVLKSKQASFGVTFNKSGWMVNSEIFYKNIDGITSRSQGFLNQYQFKNTIGSYNVKGIDLLINKRFRKFNTWASYTFADNLYTFNEMDEIHFPNNTDVKHSLSSGISFNTGDFKISSGVNWRTGIPTTLPLENQDDSNSEIEYNSANSSRLPNYLRIDLSALYEFKLRNSTKITTGISVLNILNKQNIIGKYFLEDENATPIEVSNEALEITPNITLRVTF